MTVAELRAILEAYEDDAQVVYLDNGLTWMLGPHAYYSRSHQVVLACRGAFSTQTYDRPRSAPTAADAPLWCVGD